MTDNELANPTPGEATAPEAPAADAAPARPPELADAVPAAVEPVAAAPGEPDAPAEAEAAAEAGVPAEGAVPAEAEVPAEAVAPDTVRKQRGRPRLKLDEIVVGTQVKGRVVGLAKFGVFVDIGATTDGLVHLTEFAQKRVRKVEEAVQLGDEVEVWIKDVNLETGRVSLSMRQRAEHPIAGLHAGDVITGTVTSATKYGVFVDIGSDTEGLVHISEMSSGFVEKPSDVAKTGDAVEVRVKEIDLARDRISLSMVGLANDIGLEAEGTGRAGPSPVDEEIPAEPEERMPTVVELALRRALGQMQDDMDEPEAEEVVEEAPVAPVAPVDSLGEMYERMLAAYKAEKSQH